MMSSFNVLFALFLSDNVTIMLGSSVSQILKYWWYSESG